MAQPPAPVASAAPPQESLPGDYYEQLQPPGDLEEPASVEIPAEMREPEPEEHRGMRRPSLDELERLSQHPYVQLVNQMFRSQVVDARLKV
ncbi:MAG: hypothetical protein ACI4WT_09745 [Oligosphaeraceae bacterium]